VGARRRRTTGLAPLHQLPAIGRDQLTRYPRWDEIAHARDELLPADIDFVMWLPRAGDYVALHDTTFHLHEHPERSDG
jgi:hypothetical protein